MGKANDSSSKAGEEQYAQFELGKSGDSKASARGTIVISIPGGEDAPGEQTLRGAFNANDGGDTSIAGVVGSPIGDYVGINLSFPFDITPGTYEVGVGKKVRGTIGWRWKHDELPAEPLISGTFKLTDYKPASVIINGAFKDLQYEGRKADIKGTFKTD